jgi:hypothetical protein
MSQKKTGNKTYLYVYYNHVDSGMHRQTRLCIS